MGNAWRILKEVVSGASRMAVLWAPHAAAPIDVGRAAARGLGVELLELPVTQAGDLDHASETASRDRADAMMVIGSTLFPRPASPARCPGPAPSAPGYLQLALVRARQGGSWPTIRATRSTTAGPPSMWTRSSKAPSRRSSCERSTKLDFVINLKTAKTLDFTIPPAACSRRPR